jgi:hypothetical protein
MGTLALPEYELIPKDTPKASTTLHPSSTLFSINKILPDSRQKENPVFMG